MKILLFVSDPRTQQLFQSILSWKGHTTHFSSIGTAGVLAAQKLLPDLILMDSSSPDPDTLLFLEDLGVIADTASIPVLVLVEAAQADAKKLYLKAGASACLEKPFHPHQLFAEIDQLRQ